jgi:hypothetical protein
MAKAYKKNPGTQPVPRDDKGLLIINHTDKIFGHFKVIGYHGYSEREAMAGGRELYDDERDLWVVMCDCRRFYIHTHNYVNRQLRSKNKANLMCIECRKKQ